MFLGRKNAGYIPPEKSSSTGGVGGEIGGERNGDLSLCWKLDESFADVKHDLSWSEGVDVGRDAAEGNVVARTLSSREWKDGIGTDVGWKGTGRNGYRRSLFV